MTITWTTMALLHADTPLWYSTSQMNNTITANGPTTTIHPHDLQIASPKMTLIINWCMNNSKEQGLASFCILLTIPSSITTYNFKTVTQWMMAIKPFNHPALGLSNHWGYPKSTTPFFLQHATSWLLHHCWQHTLWQYLWQQCIMLCFLFTPLLSPWY